MAKKMGLFNAWFVDGQKRTEINYRNDEEDIVYIRDGVKQGETRQSNENTHAHAGRSHTHPLPAQGIAHRHGNGAVGN